VGLRKRQLKRALETLKQALDSYQDALEELESAIIEFEEILDQSERRPGRPQAKEQGGKAGSPDLLSIWQVCQELRMGKSWVYRRIRSGEIPSVKLGHNIKVSREDLESYLEAHSFDS
jgi:excisionase family DNA binding protein